MAATYFNSIPKLLGRENYDEWCFAIENVAVLEGLTNCLNGTEQDTMLVAKAKTKVILTIDPSLYIHVKEAKNVKEVCDKLRNLYEDSGFSRKIGLLRTLINLRLNNCNSMESYINQVIETSQKLRRTGFKIDDEWIGSLLLAGLPEKFSPMIMGIENSGLDITTDSIKTKLLDMQTDGSSSGPLNGAFAAKGRFRKYPKEGNTGNMKFQNKTDKMDVICYGCKERGHYVTKCPNRQKHDYKNSKHRTTEDMNAFNAIFMSGKFDDSDIL